MIYIIGSFNGFAECVYKFYMIFVNLGEKKKTKYIKDNLNPEWNEVYFVGTLQINAFRVLNSTLKEKLLLQMML